jgi:hypothetical protein
LYPGLHAYESLLLGGLPVCVVDYRIPVLGIVTFSQRGYFVQDEEIGSLLMEKFEFEMLKNSRGIGLQR